MELDRVLELLASKGSPQAHLVSDEAPRIWLNNVWQSASAPLNAGRLNRMLVLAAPPEVRAYIHDQNAHYEFDVPGTAGIYRINVEAFTGKRSVFVTLLDQWGQPVRPLSDVEADFDSPESKSQPEAPWEVGHPVQEMADANEWYYAHAGLTLGPHTFEQLASLVKSGALPRETMVFNSRLGDWQQAKLSDLGRFYLPEKAPEWVAPSVANWKPPTEADIRTEKIFVRGIVGSGITVVVFLVGWLALSQVRSSNRAGDYSAQATTAAETLSVSTSAGALHNIRLTHDAQEPDIYTGKAQYTNNYLADVRVEAQSRDFWSRPQEWNLSVQPHDFADELESLVKNRLNDKYAAAGEDYRVYDVVLTQTPNTNNYTGVCNWDDDTSGAVETNIATFDDNGEISTWDFSVKPY